MLLSFILASLVGLPSPPVADAPQGRFDLRCRITNASGFKWTDGHWTTAPTAEDDFTLAIDTGRRTATFGNDVFTLETRPASLVMTGPSTMAASAQIVYFGDRTESAGPMSLTLAAPPVFGGGEPVLLTHVGVCDLVR